MKGYNSVLQVRYMYYYEEIMCSILLNIYNIECIEDRLNITYGRTFLIATGLSIDGWVYMFKC